MFFAGAGEILHPAARKGLRKSEAVLFEGGLVFLPGSFTNALSYSEQVRPVSTKVLNAKFFNRLWPPLIKMDVAVKARWKTFQPAAADELV